MRSVYPMGRLCGWHLFGGPVREPLSGVGAYVLLSGITGSGKGHK